MRRVTAVWTWLVCTAPFIATRVDGQAETQSSCSALIPEALGASATDRRGWGASVAVIDSAAIASLAGRTLSEVLTARLPGVSVMRSSGIVGAGSRIRLRGPSGVFIPQEPLLYMNGIRVEGEAHSIGLDGGGQAPSRIDDITVEDVRCVFVLRGPAATATYGTDAAGGVIHIVTRGASDAGRHVQGFVEGGLTADATDYPANFGTCSRASAALGTCAAGFVRSWSPLDADSPFRTASLIRGGGHVTAVSTERVSLGISGAATTADGPLVTNDHTRYSATASSSFRPSSRFDVRGDVWFLGGRTTLPLVGAPSVSILNSALLGSSVDDPVRRGYRSVPLSLLQRFGTRQRLHRLGGVARATWMPTSALSLGVVVGREDSRVRDEQTPPGIFFLDGGGYELLPTQFVSQSELRAERTTATATATVAYGPPSLRLTTNAAIDYLDRTSQQSERSFDRSGSFGGESSSFSRRETSTTSILVRQSLASNDRRFLHVGVRRDVAQRDLGAIENPTYPFANAAWDVAREFGLATGPVSSLRVRAAYGESGDLRAYEAAPLVVVVLAPGEVIGPRPVERAREVEAGVDVGLFVALDMSATMFRKRTTNGMVSRLLPPAIGTGPSVRLDPVGAWRTRGSEIALTARIIDRRNFAARLALSFTSFKNTVDALGQTPAIVGTTYRIQPGYPLYGAWGRPFTVTDVNGDGVIVPAEVVADSQPRFLGSPVPTREIGLAPSITLARSLTVSALVDYRGGHRIYNAGGRLRCNGVCEALYDPSASFTEQARAIDPNDALAGWIEDGTFMKLRELTVTWVIPGSWSRRFGARSSSATLLGRNLWTRTNYSGLDPEVSSSGQASIRQDDLFVPPPPRGVSLRFDAQW